MANTITITAKTGPAMQTTSTVFTNVTDLHFDLAANVVFFTSDGLIKQYELTGSNTITITATAFVYTMSIT